MHADFCLNERAESTRRKRSLDDETKKESDDDFRMVEHIGVREHGVCHQARERDDLIGAGSKDTRRKTAARGERAPIALHARKHENSYSHAVENTCGAQKTT